MLHDNNLIEMSLRLNRSEPLFLTILKLPEIGRRHSSNRNKPVYSRSIEPSRD